MARLAIEPAAWSRFVACARIVVSLTQPPPWPPGPVMLICPYPKPTPSGPASLAEHLTGFGAVGQGAKTIPPELKITPVPGPPPVPDVRNLRAGPGLKLPAASEL